ncbi:hypothetical protein JP0053_14480 [Helicobacter pylori]|nr:hypothetical protein JP0053_14480 [Helicobacter pylori]
MRVACIVVIIIDYFVPNHVNDGYYPKYKRAGIKFISIDPLYTETAQAFSAEWIPIRPNTDVALMLGNDALSLYEQSIR